MTQPDDTDSRERILAYLQNHNTLTLATSNEGKPFACALFYVNEGFALYFVSDPETQHIENIARNPSIGAAVHEDYRDWRLIQGIQLEGTCALVSSPIESAKALALYTHKFPFVAQLASAMAKIKFYKITPRWIRMVDNTRGFGFKEEIRL